jgi:putative transposase
MMATCSEVGLSLYWNVIIMRLIISLSSRLIRKEFADWISKFYRKPVFWSGAYFVASCGGVTLEHLKQYVEKQATPSS